MLDEVVEALKRRGFEAEAVATKAEACALVMKEAEPARSVGWGGSETVKQIGARALLEGSGKEIRDHQLDCDLFLLSANALTRDGQLEMLEKISGFTVEEAKAYIIANVKDDVTHEMAVKIKEIEAQFKEEADDAWDRAHELNEAKGGSTYIFFFNI